MDVPRLYLADPFWGGKSVVGLAGSFGTVTFGRDDNPAVKMVQEAADPWAGDTVAGNGNLYDGNVGSSRYSNTITWRATCGGSGVGAQIAEGDGLDDRPMNFALSYGSGPLYMRRPRAPWQEQPTPPEIAAAMPDENSRASAPLSSRVSTSSQSDKPGPSSR